MVDKIRTIEVFSSSVFFWFIISLSFVTYSAAIETPTFLRSSFAYPSLIP